MTMKQMNSINTILRTAIFERRGDVILNHGVPIAHLSSPADSTASMILESFTAFADLYRASHEFYESTDGLGCDDQEVSRARASLGDALDSVELIARKTTGDIYGNDHSNKPSDN